MGGPIVLPDARRAGPASGFVVPAETAPASRAGAAASAAAVDGMLLLQEVADAPARDRQARRHGRALLSALGTLQQALLDDGDGDVGDGALRQMAALLQHCPEAADPALQDVLLAVTLRAKVELARRGC